ncbi:MAG: ABC transporter substrate-binding protein [Rhodospirillales bacterium]
MRTLILKHACVVIRASAAVVAFAIGLQGVSAPLGAKTFTEAPSLSERVRQESLPPVAQRLPENPAIADFDRPGVTTGRYGGQLRLLMGRAKDIRMMVVYGYARLVRYDMKFNIVPDILEKVDVEDGRMFTLYLRKGHRWSDGRPLTTEDFRYYWEDIAFNKEMSPAGPSKILLVDGKPPKFEIIDDFTVRYTWPKPNPYFLPALAAASPLYIFQPAHYLKQFHARYADAEDLKRQVEERNQRNWVALHFYHGRQYKNDNPDLPSLQPWINTTRSPSDRFVFKRNPYYHRVDPDGRQLPYINEVVITVSSAKLIPAKAGSGEADLQARGLSFNNYTFLKRGEKRHNFMVRRWHSARGAQVALYPNLNVNDSTWRNLFRKADFRRSLSLAINRHEINQVIYFGLARESNNTVLPQSPLYLPEYPRKWAEFDLKKANKLLDGLGLTKRSDRGIRLLPDGRPMTIIVETAGESTEQTDVLELIHDSWLKAGIKLFAKPLQREVFRNRIFAGSTQVSVWFGLENAVPTADLAPLELAPTSQLQLQWPKWGLHYISGGLAGEAPDIPEAVRLAELNEAWVIAVDRAEKEKIWHGMLSIFADQVFTIGIAAGVPQPVVINNQLRNVPEAGLFNWDPGAHFGIHRPDTFWFARK